MIKITNSDNETRDKLQTQETLLDQNQIHNINQINYRNQTQELGKSVKQPDNTNAEQPPSKFGKNSQHYNYNTTRTRDYNQKNSAKTGKPNCELR